MKVVVKLVGFVVIPEDSAEEQPGSSGIEGVDIAKMSSWKKDGNRRLKVMSLVV